MGSLRPRRAAVISSLALLGSGGCERERAPLPAELPAGCPPSVREKLGVPFVAACDAAARDPAWIAAAPIGCGLGEHGTVGCPIVLPLVVEPARPDLMIPRPVVLTDGVTAHRVCAMRFGGRLPTTAERARARATQGFATLVAVADAAGAITIDDLPEWVEDGACATPSNVGPGCTLARWPEDARADLRWPDLQRCAPSLVAPDGHAEIVGLGGTCPPGAACVVRAPRAPIGAAPPALVPITCAPAGIVEHPATTNELAAFRCVVPVGALPPASPMP